MGTAEDLPFHPFGFQVHYAVNGEEGSRGLDEGCAQVGAEGSERPMNEVTVMRSWVT